MSRILFATIAAAAVGISIQTSWADSKLEAEAEKITQELIELFAECGHVGLIVYVQDEDEIGLTQNAVETAARARLRSGRIYANTTVVPSGYLRVDVLVAPDVFTYRLWLEKYQLDAITGIWDWSPTGWDVWRFGHADSAQFLLNSISRSLDTFLDDYFRVNAPAC